MRKASKTVVVTLLLCAALLSIVGTFWATDLALSVDRPGFLKVTPQGNAAIAFGQSIYVVEPTGSTKEILNFEAQGLTQVGSYDFFRNGDILLITKPVVPEF